MAIWTGNWKFNGRLYRRCAGNAGTEEVMASEKREDAEEAIVTKAMRRLGAAPALRSHFSVSNLRKREEFE